MDTIEFYSEFYEILDTHRFYQNGYDVRLNVYDHKLVTDLMDLFDKYSIYFEIEIHTIPTLGPVEPDRWCCFAWFEEDHIETLGFNFLSEERMRESNEWAAGIDTANLF